jgi:hypothetical protein
MFAVKLCPFRSVPLTVTQPLRDAAVVEVGTVTGTAKTEPALPVSLPEVSVNLT